MSLFFVLWRVSFDYIFSIVNLILEAWILLAASMVDTVVQPDVRLVFGHRQKHRRSVLDQSSSGFLWNVNLVSRRIWLQTRSKSDVDLANIGYSVIVCWSLPNVCQKGQMLIGKFVQFVKSQKHPRCFSLYYFSLDSSCPAHFSLGF